MRRRREKKGGKKNDMINVMFVFYSQEKCCEEGSTQKCSKIEGEVSSPVRSENVEKCRSITFLKTLN